MAERAHLRIQDDQGEEPSYFVEMLKTPPSKFGAIGALGLGAILSMPFGLGLGVVPLVIYAAAAGIASMFVPGSASFRDKVDSRRRAERRGRVRDHLTEELLARVSADEVHWASYGRMRERVASLEEVARNSATRLDPRNVESLDDSTVDFLGLWLASLTMWERWEEIDERALARRVEDIDESLAEVASDVDRRHLAKARAELLALLERKKSLWSRATAVDTAMMTLADQFEEIYQRVIRNPNARSLGEDVGTAIDRMRLEEAIDLAVDAELEPLMPRGKGRERERVGDGGEGAREGGDGAVDGPSGLDRARAAKAKAGAGAGVGAAGKGVASKGAQRKRARE